MGGSLAVAASQYGKIHAAVACYGIPQFEICPVSSLPYAYNVSHIKAGFAGTTVSYLWILLCGSQWINIAVCALRLCVSVAKQQSCTTVLYVATALVTFVCQTVLQQNILQVCVNQGRVALIDGVAAAI